MNTPLDPRLYRPVSKARRPSVHHRSASAHVGFSLLLLAAACSGDDDEALDGDSETEGGLADDVHGIAAASPGPGGLEAVAAQSPATAGDVTSPYVFTYPSRADRLSPGTFMSSGGGHGQSNTSWDTGAARFDGSEWVSWVANAKDPGSAGGTTVMNSESTTFDVPLFAPEDGEVIGCWRNAPDRPGAGLGYDFNGDGVFDEGAKTASGNFLLIRNATGNHMLYYAHLKQDSIPSELCPLAATEDWPSKVKGPSCDEPVYLQRPYAATVLDTPVPISAGDFMGRIGNSGASTGPHTHLAVYPLYDDPAGHWCYANSVPMQFSNLWEQIRDDEAAPADDGWDELGGGEAGPPPKFSFLAGPKHPATYARTQYLLGDYDGDSKDDLLCHDVTSGRVWVDRMDDGLDGTDVAENHAFCNGDGLDGRERVHVGDFNGDGKDDLMCHNQVTGTRAFDFAWADGQLNGAQLTYNNDWCSNDNQLLYVGDFDNDGKDDLLCHDFETGYRYIDRGYNNLNGNTDKAYYDGWCNAPHQFVHVGRFRWGTYGDGLLCHDSVTGMVWIDTPQSPTTIASTGDVLGAEHHDQTRPNFCKGGAQKLFVANVNSGVMSELVCHDSDTGEYWIDEPDFSLPYYDSINWSSGPTDWCTSQYQRLRFGDVDGDGRDDAVCFDQALGRRWYDLSDGASVYFDAVTDDDAYVGWCYGDTQGLH